MSGYGMFNILFDDWGEAASDLFSLVRGEIVQMMPVQTDIVRVAPPGDVIVSEEAVAEVEEMSRDLVTEVMHSMPAFDGKVGVLDMETEEGLAEALGIMKETIWEEDMENAEDIKGAFSTMRSPDDPDTWMTRQTVELSELTESPAGELEATMQGTGVTPIEQELFNGMSASLPEEVELMELRTVSLESFETPVGLSVGGDVEMISMGNDAMLEMLGTGFAEAIEEKMAEVPTLEELVAVDVGAAEAGEMVGQALGAVGMDLLPTLGELAGALSSTGIAAVFAVLGAELIPLISSMVEGD